MTFAQLVVCQNQKCLWDVMEQDELWEDWVHCLVSDGGLSRHIVHVGKLQRKVLGIREKDKWLMKYFSAEPVNKFDVCNNEWSQFLLIAM